MADTDDNFFSRWSRRKVLVREGVPVAPVPEAASTLAAPQAPKALGTMAAPPAPLPLAAQPTEDAGLAPGVEAPAAPAAPPLPTLADVAGLTTQSDYARFVAQGVTPEVKNAALKKLFTDPHFNVMDGLDIYIDDYGKPDPLPAGMLRKMVQSKMLRLFDDDPEEAPAAASAAPAHLDAAAGETAQAAADPTPDTAPPELNDSDEDIAVQLQPDPAAGRPGPEPGAGEDTGRQH